jgi:hypothetical protein
MPFLGTINAHEPCGLRIQDYLEKRDGQNRALAHDFVNLEQGEMQRDWAYFMDKTRHLCGNDTAWAGRDAITYAHFVISPDPRDGVDIDTLRSLAMEWVHEFFGTDTDRGSLGSYEVAVVYHDDNENHVPHAHIIVNNTDLETGRRLHIDDKTNENTLPDRLQEMAAARSLSYFDNTLPEKERRKHDAKGRYFTKAERVLLSKGYFSWKQDLCNNIQIARRTTDNEKDLLAEVSKLGIRVYEKDGDWIFCHPHNPDRWKAAGYRLGKNYAKDALLHSQEYDKKRGAGRNPAVRKNVNGFVLQDFFEGMELSAVYAHATTVSETAHTLKTNDDNNIRCMADYDRAMRSLAFRIKSTPDAPQADRLRKQYSALRNAKQTADKGIFFLGVKDMPPAFDPFAAALADAEKNSKKKGGGKGGGRTQGGQTHGTRTQSIHHGKTR